MIVGSFVPDEDVRESCNDEVNEETEDPERLVVSLRKGVQRQGNPKIVESGNRGAVHTK